MRRLASIIAMVDLVVCVRHPEIRADPMLSVVPASQDGATSLQMANIVPEDTEMVFAVFVDRLPEAVLGKRASGSAENPMSRKRGAR